MRSFKIIHADVLDGLRGLPDASFDGCLTDPPYDLKFTGKAWASLTRTVCIAALGRGRMKRNMT